MPKGFQNISRKECIAASKSISASAKQKWASAEALVGIKDYGGATSLSIISIEEQFKALVLAADSTGFRFRQLKGMDKFFENHGLRYILAYYIFIISVFNEDLLLLISRIKNTSNEVAEIISLYQTDKLGFGEKAKDFILKKLLIFTTELEWFSRIDLFRQDGFYSNFNDQLNTPITLTEGDYFETMKRLVGVRFVTNQIIDIFFSTDEFYKDELKKMRKEFNTNIFYSGIEKGITNVSLSNGDPFRFIKDIIADFNDTEE